MKILLSIISLYFSILTFSLFGSVNSSCSSSGCNPCGYNGCGGNSCGYNGCGGNSYSESEERGCSSCPYS